MLGLAVLGLLAACDHPVVEQPSDIRFRQAGTVASRQLDEISGLQASRRHPGVLWVHNDDGHPRVHAVGPAGEDLGHFDIGDGVNVDWEDMTLIPAEGRDILVLADIGDNEAQRSRVWLWFVEEPQPGPDGRFSGEVPALNWISLSYPDGPRDAEAIAWDPLRERLLILTKRDDPPRLYGLDGIVALAEREAELTSLGAVTSLRPPAPEDRRVFGARTRLVSQPTGLDISTDGRRAALLTYRSLYLFEAPPGGDWAAGLNAAPLEIIGPPRANEEAIGHTPDGNGLWVTTEGLDAPLYEFLFSTEVEATE